MSNILTTACWPLGILPFDPCALACFRVAFGERTFQIIDFSMKTPLQIAIVGLGWPGLRHADAIAAFPGTQVVAACDLNEARRQEFQQSHPGSALYHDYAKMLEHPGLDAVVIGLPNFLHHQTTLQALRAGKHVLCEKPPTMHAAEMQEVKQTAEERGLIYMFGRQMRFDRTALRARAIVAEGRLGEIYFGRTGWIRSRGIPRGLDGWFVRKDRSGGGALIDLGVHCLDDAWFLMGCPKPVTVTGRASRFFAHSTPNGGVMDVDDCAFATIRFETEALLHLEVSWAGNYPGEYDLSDPPRPAAKRERRFTTLFGTQATLSTHPFRLVEEIGGTPADVDLRDTQPSKLEELFGGQMEQFAAACTGEAAPMNSAAQALGLMQMLDGIYRSSETGREVVVAEGICPG